MEELLFTRKYNKYVNMIMRNEDVQGQEEKFGTWKDALKKALFEAENKRITWAEAKRHRVEIWLHDTESDEMELYEIVPFVRNWKIEVKLGFGEWKDFHATEETSAIKARTAKDAASDVMCRFNMDDLTEGAQFKVYPVDGYGERIAYMKPVIFDTEDLDW